jgi:hypothetical protein
LNFPEETISGVIVRGYGSWVKGKGYGLGYYEHEYQVSKVKVYAW